MSQIKYIRAGGTDYDIGATTLAPGAAIDGVAFTGGANIAHFAQCSTPAATAAKTVALTGFNLTTGARVSVKFQYGNTASNPTLEISGTGAKAIMTSGTTAAGNASWAAGEVVSLEYDGTYWQMVTGAVGNATVRGRVIVDATPTAGSANAVQSGNLATMLAAMQEQINGAYPTETLTEQYVAQIDDGADGIPVSALTINLTAGRSGGGTPSGSNVRPFAPFSSTNKVIIQRCGNNFLQIANGTVSSNGITLDYSSDGTITVNGTTNQQEFYVTNNLLQNSGTAQSAYKDYVFPLNTAMRGDATNANFRFQVPRYIGTGTTKDILYVNTTLTTTNTRSYPYNWLVLVQNAGTGTVYNDTILKPGIYLSTYTGGWEPYSGETVNIPLPDSAGSVWGGVIDLINGTLTVTWGHISAYAGETLPGEWLSSKDEYVAGNTPTTGAEVIYALNESDYTAYDLGTTYPMSTVKGVNNIFCNAGTVNVTYRADPTLFAAKIMLANQ